MMNFRVFLKSGRNIFLVKEKRRYQWTNWQRHGKEKEKKKKKEVISGYINLEEHYLPKFNFTNIHYSTPLTVHIVVQIITVTNSEAEPIVNTYLCSSSIARRKQNVRKFLSSIFYTWSYIEHLTKWSNVFFS